MDKPKVFIVDDEPEKGGIALARDLSSRAVVQAQAMHPLDVKAEHLAAAQVILVDFKLDVWPDVSDADDAPAMALCRTPRNGLALASILREHSAGEGSYPAVCLLSARLADVYGALNPENRRHVLARQASLEWVFQKETDAALLAALAGQVEVLALGMQVIQGHSNDAPLELRSVVLAPDQQALWTDDLESDVRRSLAPVNDLQQLTHGLAFARWILQRVLPYPGVLLDQNYLAAKLGVTPASLNLWLAQAGPLDPMLYRGVFAGFSGRRWWRSAIDDWLWTITDGQSLKTSSVRSALAAVSEDKLQFDDALSDPVVCVGAEFESTPVLQSIEKCVPIVPDDWPSFSAKAFASIEHVRETPYLRRLVSADDQWRLET